jgi:hypothetical protein
MGLTARLAALEQAHIADAERVAAAMERRVAAAVPTLEEAAVLAWVDRLIETEPGAAERWIAAYETLGLAVRDGDRWQVVIDEEPWEPRRRVHR